MKKTLLVGGAVLMAVVACSSPPSPDSAQAACDHIHANQTVGGVNDWLASRFTAGDLNPKVGQALTDAFQNVCPDIKTVVLQTFKADAAAVRKP